MYIICFYFIHVVSLKLYDDSALLMFESRFLWDYDIALLIARAPRAVAIEASCFCIQLIISTLKRTSARAALWKKNSLED